MLDPKRIGGQKSKLAGIIVALVAFALVAAALADTPPNPLPAYLLPGDDMISPAAGNQESPAIARGGEQYLTVWTDARSSFYADGDEAGSGQDIYAARLDAEGNLIDTTPLIINQDQSDQYDPVVVWNGENWLILWTNTIPYGPAYQPTIEAVRVSPDGEVLDADPLLIWTGATTLGTSGDHLFGAASDGTDWAVVIADQYIQGLGTKTRLVGKRVTPDGTLVNAPYYLFSPACCYFFYHGGLAYVDGVYMAVFEGYVSGSEYGIFGLRMSPTLTTLDSYPVVLAQTSMQGESRFYRTPGIAGGNGMFYVGWQLYSSGASSQILGARVDVTGQSLDGDGVPISDPGALSLSLSPDLVWDGAQWIAGWDTGGMSVARIAGDGTVLDPGGVALGVAAGSFAAAPAGGLQLVRAEAAGSGASPQDVFQVSVSPSLELGSDQCIGLGAPSQIQPELAAGSDGYLLVYRSDTSAGSQILAHPLDLDGLPLTPDPIPLADGMVDWPQLAFEGGNYLVVWSNAGAGEIRGRRLSQAGDLLDAEDIVVMNGSAPVAAAGNGQFFVAALQAADVYGVRLAVDGTVIDSPLSLGSGSGVGPSTGSVGDHFAAVFEADGTGGGSDIVISLVAPNGDVIGPLPVTEPGNGVAQRRPAIADDDTTLIVWEDERAGNWDLYGRRLLSTVSFLDPAAGFAVVTAASHQEDVAATWDGARFLTSFTDDRNVVNELDQRTDIYRNWVTGFGMVEEPDGVGLMTESVPEIDPAVAGRDGNGLYAAARFTDTSPYAAYRIWLRYAAIPTGVEDARDGVPGAAGIVSLYPNPANPLVTIRFQISQPGEVRLDIYDLKGALVRALQTESLSAGEHVVQWDGRDAGGRDAPSGAYLFRFRAGGARETGKVMLVR